MLVDEEDVGENGPQGGSHKVVDDNSKVDGKVRDNMVVDEEEVDENGPPGGSHKLVDDNSKIGHESLLTHHVSWDEYEGVANIVNDVNNSGHLSPHVIFFCTPLFSVSETCFHAL